MKYHLLTGVLLALSGVLYMVGYSTRSQLLWRRLSPLKRFFGFGSYAAAGMHSRKSSKVDRTHRRIPSAPCL